LFLINVFVVTDEFKKLPVKRRRRALPLMRIFKRQMLRPPADESHRLLFGHDLSDLCVGELPCPPIMVRRCYSHCTHVITVVMIFCGHHF